MEKIPAAFLAHIKRILSFFRKDKDETYIKLSSFIDNYKRVAKGAEFMERNQRIMMRRQKKKRIAKLKFFGIMGLLILFIISIWVRSIVTREESMGEYTSLSDPLDRIDSLDQLNEKTREAALLFLEIAKDEGLEVLITETYRSQERQEYLYTLGRTAEGNVVTWTKNSEHTKRSAFDIAKNVRGEEYSDREFFRKAAEIGKRIGLEPGYYWTDGRQDMPHFQMNWYGRVIYPEGYEKED